MNTIVNAKDIKALIKSHKLFAGIYQKHQAPLNWSRPPGFISLSKIILEQQVSLASANAHFLKLNNYIVDFTPQNILKLTDDEMRTNQVSRQKSKYLRALSNAILNKDIVLEKLKNLSEDETRKQLMAIKGIGNWTVDIYMMFCLQKKDIFPIGDIAIVNTVKELTGVKTR